MLAKSWAGAADGACGACPNMYLELVQRCVFALLNPFGAAIDFRHHGVYTGQILTSKVEPRIGRITLFLMAVDI